MGNSDSKEETLSPLMLKSKEAFKHIAKSKAHVTRDDLKESWGNLIVERLSNVLLNYIFSNRKELRLRDYTDLVELFINGSHVQKAEVIISILHKFNENPVTALEMFLQDILIAVCVIERQMPKNCIKYWAQNPTTTNTFNHLIQYYLSLTNNASHVVDLVSTIDPLLSLTFGKLFGLDEISTSLFPMWLQLKGVSDKNFKNSSMLGLEDIMFLSTLLPVDCQFEWRLLFSSQIHGESFARLSGLIINQGPTLLVIMDKDGFVFGGFAPSSWSFSPKFTGDSTSFLFTLRPKINVYYPSNFNANYQYINQGQQTLPNGLGMGGTLNYFGLWLDSEYGSGICNDSCSTYRNFTRLSKMKEFRCAEVEVWGVQQLPDNEEQRETKSVLDKDPEAKAMLELAGRSAYSDGLRGD